MTSDPVTPEQSADKLVNGNHGIDAAQANGEASEQAQSGEADQPAAGKPVPPSCKCRRGANLTVTPILVRLPSPSHSRTLPAAQGKDAKDAYTSLTLIPQPHESVQELKLAINEWIGGYWLGPYSLRIPKSRQMNGHAEEGSSSSSSDVLFAKAKEGIEIRAGEKLSEWLEVGDLFSHLKDGEERVLEVVRGESGEALYCGHHGWLG